MDAMFRISKCQYKGFPAEKLMLVRKLTDLCNDFENSSIVFENLVRALEEESCDVVIVDDFLEFCWRDLRRWVTLEGDTGMLEIFLDFSNEVKYILCEKGYPSTSEFDPDPHPVNQSLFRGRTHNIPLLLRYGLGVEFTGSFYSVLQELVLHDFV